MSLSRAQSSRDPLAGARKAASVLEEDKKVSSLLTRLAAFAQGGDLPASMLERLLVADPTLTSMTLKSLANGVFGEPGAVFSTVGEAVKTMGPEAVRFAAMSCGIDLLARDLCRKSGLNSREFTKQAVATASVGAWLSKRKGESAEKAQSAGLFHNIGVLAIAAANPGVYASVTASLAGGSTQLHEVERLSFGYDHQAVGAAALKTHHFPNFIIEAASHHHGNPIPSGGIPLMVHFGDVLAHQLGCALGFANAPQELGSEVMLSFGVNDANLGDLVGLASEAVSKLSRLPA